MKTRIALFMSMFCLLAITGCVDDPKKKSEGIPVIPGSENDTVSDPLRGDATFAGVTSSVNSVVLTGIDSVRLVTVYKIKPTQNRNLMLDEGTTYRRWLREEGMSPKDEDDFSYFMPGMDLVYGWNLINIGHYNLKTGKLSYFFSKPAIVRTVYFPGVKPDSLMNVPVKRDFFLVSAYDADTNRDSVINKKDMRRIYHIDRNNVKKTALLPADYSAIRSAYDYKTDVMYIHARRDANNNGTPESNEPVSIFWISLESPGVARKMI